MPSCLQQHFLMWGILMAVNDEIEDIHEGDEYTEPQYRLWARMMQNGIHVSKHDISQIPLITGVAPVRKKLKIEKSNVE